MNRAVLRPLRVLALASSLALAGPGALRAQTGSPAAAAAGPASAPAAVVARPADVASIDAILAALYDVISGPAGQKRDWDRMRALFAPGARLIPTSAPAGEPIVARMWSVEDYVQRAGPRLEKNGFFEREIGRSVDGFGRIAQVFSAYDSRRSVDDAKPFQRGINSIQLLNDGTRWWIVSVYWDSERAENPIPSKYLSQQGTEGRRPVQ